jgi:hypothetical protein
MEACIEQARLAALDGAIDVAPHGRVRPFGLPTQSARCTAKRHARTFTSGPRSSSGAWRALRWVLRIRQDLRDGISRSLRRMTPGVW